jgi:hypothetical protein
MGCSELLRPGRIISHCHRHYQPQPLRRLAHLLCNQRQHMVGMCGNTNALSLHLPLPACCQPSLLEAIPA